MLLPAEPVRTTLPPSQTVIGPVGIIVGKPVTETVAVLVQPLLSV